MVKHVILWTLKEEYSDAEKSEIKKGIKAGLEGLKDQIPGLLEIKVNTMPLASSTAMTLRPSLMIRRLISIAIKRLSLM